MLGRNIAKCRKQELECSQPLLTVDHLKGLDLLTEGLDLADNDGPHEMGYKLRPIFPDAHHSLLDVLP